MRLTEAEYTALLARRTGQPVPHPRVAGRAKEDQFAAHLDALAIPYQREHQFLPDRKFRFDFVLLPLVLKLAVEIDGGVHRIDSRWQADREKFNLALHNGWRVYHFALDQVKSGEAAELVRGALLLPAIRTCKQSVVVNS